jgi:hypothetical protein
MEGVAVGEHGAIVALTKLGAMLPNADQAVVEPAKVRDYLLSHSHPVGRFKAVVFEALGYRQADWTALRADLLRHAAQGAARPTEAGPFGQKYVVSATLTGPNGRQGSLVSIWLLEPPDLIPRFITAYPE